MNGAVPVCGLLGLFDTGPAVLRTLARAGLPVIGVERRTDRSGIHSRYGSRRMCPDPATEPEARAGSLREHAAHPGGNAILYPTSGRSQQ